MKGNWQVQLPLLKPVFIHVPHLFLQITLKLQIYALHIDEYKFLNIKAFFKMMKQTTNLL